MKRTHQDIAGTSVGRASCHRPQKCRRRSGTESSVYDGKYVSKWNSRARDTTVSCHTCTATRGGHRCCPEPLADLASKICAAVTPFQLVEDRCGRVPDPVMQKLIYWSFPRRESDIRRYSALSCEKFQQNSNGVSNQPPTAASSGTRSVSDNNSTNPPASRNPENADPSPEDAVTSFNNLGVVTSAELEGLEIPFEQGVALAETGKVKEALQIGFHLSCTVDDESPDAPLLANSSPVRDAPASFHVAITFDRCKITSATCDCNSSDIFFCRHVVALSIYRIRKPQMVTIRSPISDTLQQMSRDQLQKLTQYLVAHHSRVLPSAQRVADLLVDPNSDMNAVNGAPDPTAGAGLRDEDRWSLEDTEAAKHVSNLLRSNEKQESSVQLQSLLAKVREMLRARDCNGPRLLTLITDELMRFCSAHTHTSAIHSSPPQPDLCRMMWDQLGLLWVCVVLNPRISSEEREAIVTKLKGWGAQVYCPPESGEDVQQRPGQATGRNVLSRAVDAGSMRWNDTHLKKILDGESADGEVKESEEQHPSGLTLVDSDGKPLWHEHVPTACARVEALRSHGCEREAVALACAIARTIKQKWIDNFKLHQRKPINDETGQPTLPRSPLSPGLIGHPLHPIHILFDTLTGSGSDDVAADGDSDEGRDTSSIGSEPSCLCTAYEVALLTLGQQRAMPEGAHNQEKMFVSEVALIRRLKKLTLSPDMVAILRNVCQILVDGGPTSGLGEPVRRDSVPLHSLANYLFHSLLPYDRKLAFRVGIRAMQTPVLHRYESNFYREAYAHPAPTAFNVDPTRVPEVHQHPPQHHPDQARYQPPRQYYGPRTRWYIMDKLEENQCALASALVQTAKGEVMLLREVVESVQRNVGNPAHIFQLSHDAYKVATTPVGNPDSSMLNVALQMGMQVLRMTIHGGSWRRAEMVGWLVTCATEIGLCALISIIKSWYTLFSPVEATTMVANCVVSPNTAMRLNLDPRQRDELFHCVCQMSLQCAVKDPQSCALSCLTLCESVPSAFDASYHVILDSSNKRRIDASHLYTIARYLEQRGLRSRAFTVAFAATRCLAIAFNHDTHPAISDLLWTMQLAQSLGRNELTQMVSVVSRNIKCASVLSEVLRTCTSGVNSRETTNLAHFGERSLRADGPILRPLLEVAISAYVSTIHSKLSHISPRHYTEFIDFLNKARETFLLASNGHARFAHLKANLKMVYKGKKKLLNLVTLRFG